MKKNDGAIELTMGVMIFATIVYVIVALMLFANGCTVSPSGTTNCVIDPFPSLVLPGSPSPSTNTCNYGITAAFQCPAVGYWLDPYTDPTDGQLNVSCVPGTIINYGSIPVTDICGGLSNISYQCPVSGTYDNPYTNVPQACDPSHVPGINTCLGYNFLPTGSYSYYTSTSTVPDPNSCSGIWSVFCPLICFFGDLISWLSVFLGTIAAYLVFIFDPADGLLVWFIKLIWNLVLFGWIWSGPLSPPYPINFLVGIPLTAMGAFVLIEAANTALRVIKGWL